MGERLENDIHQLEVDHLVVGDGGRRLGIGDRARRVCEPHHLAHAVVEMQVRAEAADERVEHASLDHGGPQIDRTSGLRSAVGEVEARDPVLDGDGDGKLHRLVDHDAVAVEQPFGRRLSLRQFGNGRAQFVRRALEDGREGIADRARAETFAQLLDALRAHLRHRDLGVDVAAHERRLTAVGEDDAFDIGLRDARVHDFDRRHQQALVEHFGGIGRGRARDRAAHVRLVRDRTRKRDDPAGREHRRDEGHVGDVGQAALVGMIGDEDVAVLDRVDAAIELEDAADEMAVDRGVEEHRRRHDQAPLAVEDHAAEVARLADDGRVAGAVEMVVHFIDQARDLVAQDLDGDGVHAHALARIRLP